MELESTFALQQIRSLVRSLSKSSHGSRSPLRSHPSLPVGKDKICLQLEKWADVLAEPINTDDLIRARIEKIFTFFIKIASSNDLATTPAVKSLQDALSILRRGGDFSRQAKTNWRERLSQLSLPSKAQYQRLSHLRDLCVHCFPLYNIWDSISFIYTVCVEDVTTQLGAELHLYQFRMIIKALCDCKAYFTNFARTNTVAAGWTVETRNQPFNIAFATTCIGEEKEKAEMAEARREFMKTLTDKLKNESKKINERTKSPNSAGNCPEYLVWPIVCRQIGSYKSLCFNLSKERAYRCCTHCETTLEKLGVNDIHIDDLCKTALLSTGNISNTHPYPWRELKEQEEILKEYGKLTNL
jgi:hypothetical protein